MKPLPASPIEAPAQATPPAPEAGDATVTPLIPRPDSPFGSGEAPKAQTEEPVAPTVPSLIDRGVDAAKRAAESTKAKLSDAEFRGKLIDMSVTAARVGYTAIKSSRMVEFNPENGKPRIKPKAAEHAAASPGATAARLGFQVGKAIVKEHGTYQKRQAARQAKN